MSTTSHQIGVICVSRDNATSTIHNVFSNSKQFKLCTSEKNIKTHFNVLTYNLQWENGTAILTRTWEHDNFNEICRDISSEVKCRRKEMNTLLEENNAINVKEHCTDQELEELSEKYKVNMYLIRKHQQEIKRLSAPRDIPATSITTTERIALQPHVVVPVFKLAVTWMPIPVLMSTDDPREEIAPPANKVQEDRNVFFTLSEWEKSIDHGTSNKGPNGRSSDKCNKKFKKKFHRKYIAFTP